MSRHVTTSPPADRDPLPIDRSLAEPVWAQVRHDLERRLDAGQFQDAFPGELAIAAQYGVSRHSVREALRGMRAAGIVTADRGRASRVAAGYVEQPIGALYSLFAAVEASGQVQRSIVRALEIRHDRVAAVKLALDESEPLIFLERLRLADDTPLAVDQAWLPASVASPLLEADFTRTALYRELHERCGARLTGGCERITALSPTRDEHALLELPADVAAFAIERVGYLADRAIEWRHTLIRGDRFAMTARFDAHGEYHLDVAAR